MPVLPGFAARAGIVACLLLACEAPFEGLSNRIKGFLSLRHGQCKTA